jgi:hypothetical protein
MIEIKNRYTGSVIRTVDAEDLYGANLYGANLYGANLSGANLYGANLSGANLSGANLSDADLSGADLSCANLDSANLRYADLSGADLSGANLSGANLSGANLSGANLSGANLDSASAIVCAGAFAVEPDAGRAAAVLSQITEHPETWQQDAWHSACGTRHCVAGWAVTLDGARGKTLEAVLGTATAAAVLLAVPGAELPSFAEDATDEETIGRLRGIASLSPRTLPPTLAKLRADYVQGGNDPALMSGADLAAAFDAIVAAARRETP